MKKVQITFSMISRPLGGLKFRRRITIIDLPDDVAEDLETRQSRSKYVSDQEHNNPSRHPIAELLQIIANVHGYQESIFELAEIIGDAMEE